jgi:hypothetical protein
MRSVSSSLSGLLSLSLLASSLLPVLAPSPGWAQGSSNKAAADVLFDQGKKLMDEGKFGEACPKFAESQRLDPAPGTLIWLADCYEKNGQTASSWSTYREALAAAKAASQAQRESLARERIAALDKILSTLTLQIPDRSLQGLEVKVDGSPVGQPLWGTPIPYDPGPHTIEATAPNHAPFQVKIDLGKNASKLTVEIPKLTPSAAPPPTAPPSASAAPASTSAAPAAPTGDAPAEKSSMRTVGFVVGGVGLAAGILGTILAVTARSSAQTAIDDCRSRGFCSQDELDRHDSAKGRNTAGLVIGGIGGALLVGGAVLVLTSPKETKTGSIWFSPQAGRTFSGLSLGGSF